jgi:hypothetical protein
VKEGTNARKALGAGKEGARAASRPEEERLRIVRKHFPEADAKDRALVGLFLGFNARSRLPQFRPA